MSPAVQELKRARGRPKGSKDRVARKSALSNNDEAARDSPPNSSSSTPAPPSKRRASSSAETPQPNGFTPINLGDRNTSRSGRSLSKTPKAAPQSSDPESLGPALKKRASARSTSRVSSTEPSARTRLPDHGSQSNLKASPVPPIVAPSPTPPLGANGYRSLYGQSPYGTPATSNGGPKYTQSYLNFSSSANVDPPINTIQPAPGSMPAPRKTLPRTALPQQRTLAPGPTLPVISRPISEILEAYQEQYDVTQKHYRAFERFTWNIKIRNLTRNVFVKLAAMRSRRARLHFMVKEIKSLKKTGTDAVEIVEIDRNLVWPPVLGEYPTWYYDLATPALRVELHQCINALKLRITNELGGFERAKMMGQILRRERRTALVDEMKWLDIQGQMKEYESMLDRLGGVDVRPLLTT
ncbi:hypothetical protein BKA65DRAFT_517443 [Rhexocercosporidium sp. MPI-PUGE-AT-0058]|nr:hypothetical protein BKA65DRAFT_517443 [Rhexocercosporidium sp. MPI-PUGE-AT-0058]